MAFEMLFALSARRHKVQLVEHCDVSLHGELAREAENAMDTNGY